MNRSASSRTLHWFARRFPAGRIAFALLLIGLPLGLAACTVPSAPLRPKITASLGPADLVTRYYYEFYVYNSGLCSFGTSRDMAAPPGTVLVGADNYFKDTNEPVFPCIQKNDYTYRAGVRFNLSEFRGFAGIVIEKATLSWRIDRAIVRSGNGAPSGVASGPDVTNCVGALMEGKQSPFTQGAYLPAIPYRSGQGDVTGLVQSWIMNGDPNWGFVLAGVNESYNRNDAACVNVISHFILTLTYTRA